MTVGSLYRPSVKRLHLLREWLTWKLLRLAKHEDAPRLVALTGDYIADRIRTFGLYERDELENLRDWILPKDFGYGRVALDVGANVGNHAIFLSRIFDNVIAFEPNPLAHSICSLNLQINKVENVDLRPVGLSDASGFAVPVSREGNLGATHLLPIAAQSVETVTVAVGDELLGNLENIGFVKIDIEGGEAAALSGLAETLRRNRPIVMMEQLSDSITDGTSPAYRILMSLRYRCFEMRRYPRQPLLEMLTALFTGRKSFKLEEVSELKDRHYPILIFLPEGHAH